ncbi:MAG: fasciclin domain-containing protein [Paludibacter sp.]
MKKINKTSIKLICTSLVMVGFMSCNLAGLDLQQNYKYTYAPANLTMNMTAYEFIESRKNIDMSLLYEAINRAGVNELFVASDRTYIVMNDIAFSSYLTAKKYEGIKSVPLVDLKKLLNQYIGIGEYNTLALNTFPLKVQTLEPTFQLAMYLKPAAIDTQNKYYFYVTAWGKTTTTYVVSQNLKPTNGIIHVVESYLQ